MNGYITGYFGKWHNSNEDIAAFNSTVSGTSRQCVVFEAIVITSALCVQIALGT